MTSARKVSELVEALVLAGGSSSESRDILDLRGRLDGPQVCGWADVVASLPMVGVDAISAIDAFGDHVDLGGASSELIGQDLRIQVSKRCGSATAFCFTPEGVGAIFSDLHFAPKVRKVWVACGLDSFKTESCSVDPWGDDAYEVVAADDEVAAPDPRRLVKDFVGGRVPKSVFPYLLSSGVPASSKVFEKWRDLAVVRLLHSLVNEVIQAKEPEFVITGTRPRKIGGHLNAPYSEDLFSAVSNAARWIYASGRDVDIRFTLFTYELSREWPESLGLQVGFAARGEQALEAAKTAFRAHIQETSKDTLKSLGDLRKTLSEEVAKVVSQTRELLGTMWRDFMVAVTAFLGRVVLLGSDKPLADPAPLKALLFGAAIFLLLSLALSLWSNKRFMAISDASRQEWRKKLFGFLGEDDFKKLSDIPIAESKREYRRVVALVATAYAVVIGCLLLSAWNVGYYPGNEGGSPKGSVERMNSAPVTPSVAAPPTQAVSSASLPEADPRASTSKMDNKKLHVR